MSLNQKSFLMTAAVIFFFTTSAFAGLVSGKVFSYDSGTRKLTLSTVNPASGENQNSEIWVAADAKLEGLGALSEIKQGDTLWVETETDSEGNLRTRKITRT